MTIYASVSRSVVRRAVMLAAVVTSVNLSSAAAQEPQPPQLPQQQQRQLKVFSLQNTQASNIAQTLRTILSDGRRPRR
jgi:hypothetical protein